MFMPCILLQLPRIEGHSAVGVSLKTYIIYSHNIFMTEKSVESHFPLIHIGENQELPHLWPKKKSDGNISN